MSPELRILRARWCAHVAGLGRADAAISQQLFDGICESYSQPHRVYHTLDHLVQLFGTLERYDDWIHDPLRLAFAAWYHDVVYDPRSRDNESRSAERARSELASLRAAEPFIQRVVSLILATKTHAEGGADADDDLFLDADYSILGAEPRAYEAYAAQVRLEYAHLSDDEWRTGRGGFLRAAVARSRTFRTDLFEVRLGPQARSNMAAEIRTLTASRGGRAPLS